MPGFDPGAAGLPQLQGPAPVLSLANNMAGQQAQQQLQQNQSAALGQDVQSKANAMQLSMLSGVLNEPDPDKQRALLQNIVPIANKLNPGRQIDPNIDIPTIRALIQSQVPVGEQPTYQMNQAKANFYKSLMGGQPQQGNPAQGGEPGNQPAGNPSGSVLSPAQQQGLAIFDPAGSNALMDVQKTQYDSPQGKENSKNAELTGQNAAESEKTLNVMNANLPQVMQRFGEMRDAAKEAGYGVGNNNEGNGWAQEYHKNFSDDKTGKANALLAQRAAQGILPELGPQLAQAGVKGNKFLEGIANSASGLDLAAAPDAKAAVINGLQEQYVRNLKSTAAQVRSYGGKAPTDDEIDSAVNQYTGAKGQAQTQMKGQPQNAPSAAPKPVAGSTIYKGHLFIGGDPSSPSAWRPVGGGTSGSW